MRQSGYGAGAEVIVRDTLDWAFGSKARFGIDAGNAHRDGLAVKGEGPAILGQERNQAGGSRDITRRRACLTAIFFKIERDLGEVARSLAICNDTRKQDEG